METAQEEGSAVAVEGPGQEHLPDGDRLIDEEKLNDEMEVTDGSGDSQIDTIVKDVTNEIDNDTSDLGNKTNGDTETGEGTTSKIDPNETCEMDTNDQPGEVCSGEISSTSNNLSEGTTEYENKYVVPESENLKVSTEQTDIEKDNSEVVFDSDKVDKMNDNNIGADTDINTSKESMETEIEENNEMVKIAEKGENEHVTDNERNECDSMEVSNTEDCRTVGLSQSIKTDYGNITDEVTDSQNVCQSQDNFTSEVNENYSHAKDMENDNNMTNVMSDSDSNNKVDSTQLGNEESGCHGKDIDEIVLNDMDSSEADSIQTGTCKTESNEDNRIEADFALSENNKADSINPDSENIHTIQNEIMPESTKITQNEAENSSSDIDKTKLGLNQASIDEKTLAQSFNSHSSEQLGASKENNEKVSELFSENLDENNTSSNIMDIQESHSVIESQNKQLQHSEDSIYISKSEDCTESVPENILTDSDAIAIDVNKDLHGVNNTKADHEKTEVSLDKPTATDSSAPDSQPARFYHHLVGNSEAVVESSSPDQSEQPVRFYHHLIGDSDNMVDSCEAGQEDSEVDSSAPDQPVKVYHHLVKDEVVMLDEEDSKDGKSEASLEEVSEDEDLGEIGASKIDGNNSGIEEVSDTGEVDDENSGIEEVSDDEVDMGNDSKETKGVESGVEEVSEEEDEEIMKKEPDPTAGVEDVSSEEEIEEDAEQEEGEEVEEEEEETEEETEEEEEGEEEEEEEGEEEEEEDVDSDNKEAAEVSQDTEVETVDDTGKNDDQIVQEILEKITVKIEESETKSEKEEKRSRSSSEKRKKKKKDRRESTKSKSSGTSNRDLKDINDRLRAQASYGGDDVELDYDDIHEEAKDKQGTDGEISSGSESDEGELEEEEDCEEGEIKEPGSKPFVKPTCRFFMRGHCTWGNNCRFLHPGVNDKGNYQLIERPGFNNKQQKQYDDQWEDQQRSPSPEPSPPRKTEPKEETAWERGLRQAKELRKKALERRELDTNFEHKKLHLSIEENPEYNKENTLDSERAVKKYYEKLEPLSDDEYYDQTPVRLQQKQMEQSWIHGQYENFEVRWTRDPHYMGNQHAGYPGHPRDPRYPTDRAQYRGAQGRYTSPPVRPSPRRFSPSPPPQYQNRYITQRDPHLELRREKLREKQQRSPSPIKRTNTSPQRIKADEWHDPWRRSNVNRATSPGKKRSRSRGRRRSRRSHSYSSSYSSSSYSSGSRSSSVSSGSSRSRSRSRSSSYSSRSPSRRAAGVQRRRRPSTRGGRGRRPPISNPRVDPARNNVSHFQGGRPGRSPDKRHNLPSPNKAPKGAPPSRGPAGNRPPHPAPVIREAPVRKPSPPPQRKFSMKVDTKDRQLPPSALTKKSKGRRGSSSTSRSRSSSSSSSRSSSYSSRSSRSSSSSSSGSADSDHLYRNIGGRDKSSKKRNDKPSRPNPSPTKRQIPMKPSGRPAQVAPPKPKDPLKMTGQKSNIKLTLIKPNEKPPPAPVPSKKRAAEVTNEGPSAKRPNVTPAPPKQDKPVKRPERPTPISPTKAAPRPAPAVPKAVAQPPPQAPALAVPQPATTKKKSTVSRREELLKQLKAVEDAIAKKKKKMV